MLVMKEKIICFSFGLSPENIDQCKTSYYEAYRDAPDLEVVAVTKSMLERKVGDVMDGILAGADDKCAGQATDGGQAASPDVCKYRVVVVNTMEREQVLQVMRSFKAVLPDPQNMIFAVITDTARTWVFADYFGHLSCEHEQMMKR